MDMALALYRRYRPDTFDGVIGQDQVVVPLMHALDNGKLTQAYLFSGPRGCGKTSCARILARCLNCEKGPTSHPCGVCPSCRDLANGGNGAVDVVEIDAASHNGVEDARNIRDKAQLAPVRDRYKIFILDEAHMVSPQGFNALLKIVEEPPEHVIFIFATTEPDKVISTIRSRTHHYPFRLVPPEVMRPHLESICSEEKVTTEPGVLDLAMRAGGGSVRDTLSVLDQLMAGSDNGTITYDSATALLGFTPDGLISGALDALVSKDGAALYSVIEKVVVGGYEPQRFAEDLLERLRDLLVLGIAGPSAMTALGEESATVRAEALSKYASKLDAAVVTRLAMCVNDTLAELGSARSTRMALEIMTAELLQIVEQKDAPHGQVQNAQPATMPAQATAPMAAPAAAPAVATVSPAVSTPAVAGSITARPQAIPQPTAAGVSSDVSYADLWKQTLQAMPQDLRSYVDEKHVPSVDFKRNSLGGTHLVFTFDVPLSQHAFAMAVTSDHKKVPTLVQQEVRKLFGPSASIAPSPVAANGEVVKKMRSLTPQEQAAVKREVAMRALKNTALLSHASGASVAERQPQAHKTNDQSSTEKSEQKEDAAPADAGGHDSVDGDARSEKKIPVPAAGDMTDPWADQLQSARAAQDAANAAPTQDSGAPRVRQTMPSRSPAQQSAPAEAVQAEASAAIPNQVMPMSQLDADGVAFSVPVSAPANGSVTTAADPERPEDEYSLDDASIAESERLSEEELKKLLDVKSVREIPASNDAAE